MDFSQKSYSKPSFSKKAKDNEIGTISGSFRQYSPPRPNKAPPPPYTSGTQFTNSAQPQPNPGVDPTLVNLCTYMTTCMRPQSTPNPNPSIIKVPVPEFNGKTNPVTWLCSFKSAASNNNWSDDVKASQAKFHLKGTAASWYNVTFAHLRQPNQGPEDVIAPYHQFLREFENNFKPKDFALAQLNKLHKMKKRPTDNYKAFYHKLMETALDADPMMSESTKLHYIKTALADDPISERFFGLSKLDEIIRVLSDKDEWEKEMQNKTLVPKPVYNSPKQTPSKYEPKRVFYKAKGDFDLKPNIPKTSGEPKTILGFKDRCVNCEIIGHRVGECKRPRDQDRIKANLDKWRKQQAAAAASTKAKIESIETQEIETQESPENEENMTDTYTTEIGEPQHSSDDENDSESDENKSETTEDESQRIKTLRINNTNVQDLSTEDKKFISDLNSNKSPGLEIKVEGILTNVLIDTGSCVTVVDYDFAVQRGYKMNAWPSKRLYAVNGLEVTPKFIIRALEFDYKGKKFLIDCAVLTDVKPSIIVGMDLISKSGMIIDCYHRVVNFASIRRTKPTNKTTNSKEKKNKSKTKDKKKPKINVNKTSDIKNQTTVKPVVTNNNNKDKLEGKGKRLQRLSVYGGLQTRPIVNNTSFCDQTKPIDIKLKTIKRNPYKNYLSKSSQHYHDYRIDNNNVNNNKAITKRQVNDYSPELNSESKVNKNVNQFIDIEILKKAVRSRMKFFKQALAASEDVKTRSRFKLGQKNVSHDNMSTYLSARTPMTSSSGGICNDSYLTKHESRLYST